MKFEVLESNNKKVIYKRVLPAKGRKAHVKLRDEMSLPKVTLRCFSLEDIKRLHKIEGEISKEYRTRHLGKLSQIKKGLKGFIID
mgnify:CR=1 FL=1